MITKFSPLALVAALIVTLQGCGGTKTISPEEAQARRKGSLNVYDDNQVWLRSGDTSPFVAWTNDPKDIFALEIDGKIYNTKDIAKVEVLQKTRLIAVSLKSGEKITAPYLFNHPDREWDVMWHICNARKECKVGGNFYRRDPNGPIGRFLTGVYERDFRVMPERDPARELIRDSRSIPTSSDVQFLTKAEGDEVNKKIAGLSQQWAKIVQEREKKQVEKQLAFQAQERAIEAEAVQVRKTLRIGARTNCGQVFEIRLPMIGVQTTLGMQYIDISRLYGPSANCRFVNGQYVGR